MRNGQTDETSRVEKRRSHSRRSVLGAIATAAGIGLAGCSGGDGDGTASPGDGSGDGGGNGGSGGSGGNDYTTDPCPSPPFSYSQFTVENSDNQYPPFVVEAPDFPQVVNTGGVAFNYGNADVTTNASAAFNRLSPGWSELLGSMAEEYEESSDQYDLLPTDARSFTKASSAGNSTVSIWQTIVAWPSQDGVMSVLISFQTNGGSACSEATAELQTRMVESIEPA